MGFLTPLFLLGLLAAAIPVAIHLIRRAAPPKVMFGTLRFLKQTTRKLVLFQQIQQWLLLLLRAAVICLLVFAFARPLVYQAQVAQLTGMQPESVVILLDGSLAMRFGDRFERAVEEAQRVVEQLGAGDEIAMIRFADTVQQQTPLTTDSGTVRAVLAQQREAAYEPARFLPALRLANDLLADARHERRRIIMISSFTESGLDDSVTDWMLAPGVAFTSVSVGGGVSRNLSLTDVRVPGQLLETESDAQILARVRSTGSVFQDSGELALWLNGVQVAIAPVSLAGRSEGVVSLPVTLEASGVYAGELRLAEDDFEEDNHWYFTMEVLPRMEVLVVNGAPSDNWFDDAAHWLRLALEGPEVSPFDVTQVDWRRLDEIVPQAFDAVVLLNVPTLTEEQQGALSTFVADGGSLLVAPGDRVQGAGFNEQLGEMSPLQLIDQRLMSTGDYVLMADMDRRHPALRSLDVDWGTRFKGYWATEPVDDAAVLMRFDTGEPLLAEREFGDGRVMMVTTSLDLAWSNFPLQGLYLPFVHELLTYMIQPVERESAYRVGDVIDMSDLFNGTQQPVLLQEPDGNGAELPPDSPYYRARLPGFVEATDGTRYAMNVTSDASLLTPLDVDWLYDSVINPDTTPEVSQRVQTARLMMEVEQPQRLWWWILLAVAFLLIVEGWVANRTYR